MQGSRNLSENSFSPGPSKNTVMDASKKIRKAPRNWILLPPGDAALTRRTKAAGDHWVVNEKKGRRNYSKGVWAPKNTVDQIRKDLAAERSTEEFSKRKKVAAQRRIRAQAEYVENFNGAVLAFLNFHPNHTHLAQQMATAVTQHATPVGSGTVARTKKIPIERRAEAAVIAWMRHQTTGYDSMVVQQVKGKRRELRRKLAQRSKKLLSQYRVSDSVSLDLSLIHI